MLASSSGKRISPPARRTFGCKIQYPTWDKYSTDQYFVGGNTFVIVCHYSGIPMPLEWPKDLEIANEQ